MIDGSTAQPALRTIKPSRIVSATGLFIARAARQVFVFRWQQSRPRSSHTGHAAPHVWWESCLPPLGTDSRLDRILSYRALPKTQLELPSIGSERKTHFPHRRRFFDPGVCSRSG
jgi:hypothetical protein